MRVGSETSPADQDDYYGIVPEKYNPWLNLDFWQRQLTCKGDASWKHVTESVGNSLKMVREATETWLEEHVMEPSALPAPPSLRPPAERVPMTHVQL